jgi:hypothetical protein
MGTSADVGEDECFAGGSYKSTEEWGLARSHGKS